MECKNFYLKKFGTSSENQLQKVRIEGLIHDDFFFSGRKMMTSFSVGETTTSYYFYSAILVIFSVSTFMKIFSNWHSFGGGASDNRTTVSGTRVVGTQQGSYRPVRSGQPKFSKLEGQLFRSMPRHSEQARGKGEKVSLLPIFIITPLVRPTDSLFTSVYPESS